ncbi:MAG: hypothetical protein CL922_05560, partial [Deltaproteobacteria bacterium]|nr:hypothetical protein [Deltaproteobacteria bacterium]
MKTKLTILTLISLLVLPTLGQEQDREKERKRAAERPNRAGENAGKRAGENAGKRAGENAGRPAGRRPGKPSGEGDRSERHRPD